MNILTEKLKWEDLVIVIERKPELLRSPAALRRHVFESGGITLIELLEWQAQQGVKND